MKWNIIKPILIVGVIALLCGYIEHNFTFNFVALYIILIVLMGVLVFFVKEHKYTNRVFDNSPVKDFVRSKYNAPIYYRFKVFASSYLMILIFGVLAIYTFNNYVNPDKNIFYNHDHHAIKIEGMKINEGFMVAGNNGQSFLDNSTINGSVRVASYNNEHVTLRLDGVTAPIYTKHYNDEGAPLKDSCINKESLFYFPSENKNDRLNVTFTNRYDQVGSNVTRLNLEVEQRHDAHGLIKRGKDSTLYIFSSVDRRDTSSFTTFLKSGFELQSIARDAYTMMDLSGVNIVRPIIYRNLKNRFLKDKYAPQDYLIALEKQNEIKSISINGSDPISVDYKLRESSTIEIPYGQAFYIGMGQNATVAVKFEKINVQDDSFDVAIKYELPRYQALSSTNRGKETTLMVTSSIINAQDDPEASGLINNITENLVVADLFENHGNNMNIEPFFVSYISDISSVDMLFRVLTDSGATVKSGIKAGEIFPNILSRDGNYEWIVSIENFKETTPFKASKLVWILFGVIAASLFMMYFSSVNYLYTSVECAAYLLLIAYLTVKLFLLWRITVFSPVTSISFYEFCHFRDDSWLESIKWALFALYTVLFFVKLLIIRPITLGKDCRVLMRYIEMQPSFWNKFSLALCLVVAMSLVLPAWREIISGWICFVIVICCAGAIFLILKIVLEREPLVYAMMGIVALIVLMAIINAFSLVAAMIILSLVSAICLVRIIVLTTSKTQLKWVVFAVTILAAGAYIIMEHMLNMPMVRVLGGALIYFTIDWFIYKMFATSYDESFNDMDNDEPSDNTAFALSVWNMLCMSAATFYADGGYGIMFTLFMIFALWVKIVDVSNYSNYNHVGRKWAIPAVLIPIMVALVAIILCYKRIFLGLYNSVSANSEWIFILLCIVAVLIFTYAVMWVLNIKGKKVTLWNGRVPLPHLIIPVVAFIAAIVVINFDILDKFTGGHTEYRIRVHMEKPTEVLANVETDSEQNKFLQASLNDWILYEYQNIGSEIQAFGEDGNGYFKLQPQSKIGAMWFAQTTDICLSRYIIAEHGLMLAWLFVASFAVFLLISLQAFAVERWARLITIQVALLFAVQALMIFLANTRAFIFFGQDFPLISITSRLAAWYFIVLMLLCVGAALFGKKQYNALVRLEDMYDPYGNGPEMAIRIGKRNQTSIYFICILFATAAVSLYLTGRSTNNAEGLIYEKEKQNVSTETLINSTSVGDYASYHDGIYDIEFLMALVNNDLDTHITPALKSYQRTLGERVPLKRDMSAFVEQLFKYDTMMMAIDKCDSLTRRLLNTYRVSGSRHNRASNMICLRNVRTIDYQKVKGRNGYRVVYQDSLEFAMGVNTVNYQMPNRRRSQWCGSVIEQRESDLSDTTYIKDNVLFIPKCITGDEDIQLVKADDNRQLTVIGADGIIALSSGGVNVVNVRSSDYVIDGANGTLNDLPLQRNNYFAKNILINGTRAFIYPFGHKMFWARNIVANIITKYKKLPEKEKAEWANKDIVLSVNSDLTSQIYNVYHKELSRYSNKDVASDRSVIVADGDGKVRAMVDYRFNDKYRVNPNDYSRIAKISDSLFINFEKGRASETRYFGNFACNNLRRGPGSTQKPIVWTAVTTMYNTGWWKDLKLVRPVENRQTKVGKHFLFSKYAGRHIERQFRSLYGDEFGNKDGLIDIQYYMCKSSNYYNSIMAYIGTFTKEDLLVPGFMSVANTNNHSTLLYKSSQPTEPVKRKGERDADFKKRHFEWMEECQNTFPEMKINSIGGSKVLSFNRFLSAENAMGDIAQDANALLPQGLLRNFELPIYYDNEKKRPSRFFNISVRKGRSSDRQLNEYMVRSVAIGNNTVWNVSPFDMAQMYGRLITLNKGYNLSLYSYSFDQQSASAAYDPFEIDLDTWKNMSDYLEVRNELIMGMSRVFSDGTASNVKGTNSAGEDEKSIVREYNVNGRKFVIKVDTGNSTNQRSDIPTFYIYGKTGTINGYWNGVDKDDHLLATIITDRPLTQCSFEELESVKYYVIYQVDYEYSGNGGWQTIDGSVIRRVIESTDFMDYMGVN